MINAWINALKSVLRMQESLCRYLFYLLRAFRARPLPSARHSSLQPCVEHTRRIESIMRTMTFPLNKTQRILNNLFTISVASRFFPSLLVLGIQRVRLSSTIHFGCSLVFSCLIADGLILLRLSDSIALCVFALCLVSTWMKQLHCLQCNGATHNVV